MLTHLVFLSAASAVFAFPSVAIGKGELPPILQRSNASPVIDGVIHPAEWSQALPLGIIEDEQGALPATEAWIAIDQTHFYVAVRCGEPDPSKIKAEVLPDEIKGKVWTDDSIEVFLDLGNTGKIISHLVANTEGTLYDSLIVNSTHVPAGWTSEAITRTRIGKSSWEMEIAIPMESMGHRVKPGEVIAINIGRNRHPNGQREQASYAGANFTLTKHFRPLLVEGPMTLGSASLISLRRGPFIPNTSGLWEFQIVEGTLDAAALQIAFPAAAPEAKTAVNIGKRFITIPFAGGSEADMSQCVLRHGLETVYASDFEVRKPPAPERIAETRKPLFQELLDPHPDGLSARGVLSWAHELSQQMIKVVPARSGMEYIGSKTPYEAYKRDRANIVVTLGLYRQNPELLALSKKYDIPWAIHLRNGSAVEKGAPIFGKVNSKQIPWFLDPRATEAYLENAQSAIDLARENPTIQWIFAGDEVWESMHRTLRIALDAKESYPELMAVDREVREKYGYGKFGLPESGNDPNPFRWIATYRWEADKMDELAKAVKQMIERDAPHLKFVSWDPMTGHRPYGIARWGEVFDVVTAQIYPASDVDRDHVGFTTRFYADLANSREFWPVPHIEHYPASFNAAEVEEILSQAFRSGATGLHLWSADHLNGAVRKAGTSINERIGAPERWAVVRSVIEYLATPFRVRQPKPDTAIFYSNTSYQGTGAPATFSAENHIEWIYTLLGPKLRSALRFVDDIGVMKNPLFPSQYKTVYVPYMPIADDAEYSALQAFAEDGGTLVICDPLAFRHRSDGSARMPGGIMPPLKSLEQGAPRALTSKLMQLKETPTMLPAFAGAYELDMKSGQALAEYIGGGAAIVEMPIGRGKVVWFAQSPLMPRVITSPEWVRFFEALQARYGAAMGQDVWRFRFPKTPAPTSDRPKGECLTGNYFEWVQSEPKPISNAAVSGVYQLHGVDTKGTEAIGQNISFGKGRLTNRLNGTQAQNASPASMFVLPCTADKEWFIEWRFTAPVQAKTGRLFYSGRLPSGWCETSADGENWKRVGQWAASETPESHDVGMVYVSLAESEGAYVRLHFSPAAPFSLVEIDFWGAVRQ